MIVHLNKQEMALTEQAGKLRWQLARAAGVKDRVVDKDRNPYDIDCLGVRAEVAVGKLLNLDFSAATLGIDSGGDLFVPIKDDDFMSLQIKATFHKSGNLLFRHDCKFEFQTALLVCQMSSDVYDVVGCMGVQQIQARKIKVDKGKGYVGWQINRTDLAPVSDLWAYIQKRRYS
jgi:hypothetical protein